MHPIQNLLSFVKTEAAKLSTLSGKEKVEYAATYYRIYFFCLLVVVVAGFYVADVVIQSQKEIVLQGFFTNDDYGFFSAQTIQDDYAEYCALEAQQRIVFDDIMYIDLTGEASDYSAASNGKVLAYLTTHELDFMVTSKAVYEYYLPTLPMVNLLEVLPQDLLERLSDSLIYTTSDKTCAYAINMADSFLIADSTYTQDAQVSDFYYLLIPSSTERLEQTIDFISYAFP